MLIYILIILLVIIIIYRKFYLTSKKSKKSKNIQPIIVFQVSGSNINPKSLYIFDDGKYEIDVNGKSIVKDQLSDDQFQLMTNLINNEDIVMKDEIYTGTDMVYKTLIVNGVKINLDDGSPYPNSNMLIPGIKLGLKMLAL